jgi:prepilin-type processing-associated H-X9-DG protein
MMNDESRDDLDEHNIPMTDEWRAFIAPRRVTFSLRTMFFVVTCVAVFFAGVRVAGNDGSQFFVGALFLSFFLAIWSSARRGFPVRPGIFFLLSILFAVLSLPLLVIKGHSAARRVQCDNNLRQIGEALKSYHQKYGSFPPAYVADANGKPLYSWRAIIFAEMGRTDLLQRLQPNEPWNGPKNSLLAPEWWMNFHCPSDQQSGQMTSYVAIVGPRSAWPAPQVSKLAEFKNPAKTILVLELPNSGVNWLEPRDLFVGQLKEGLGAIVPPDSLPPYSDGFEALFADGHVETLPANIDPQVLSEMLEVDPGGDTSK